MPRTYGTNAYARDGYLGSQQWAPACHLIHHKMSITSWSDSSQDSAILRITRCQTIAEVTHHKMLRSAETPDEQKGVMRFGLKRYKSIIRIHHIPILGVDGRLTARKNSNAHAWILSWIGRTSYPLVAAAPVFDAWLFWYILGPSGRLWCQFAILFWHRFQYAFRISFQFISGLSSVTTLMFVCSLDVRTLNVWHRWNRWPLRRMYVFTLSEQILFKEMLVPSLGTQTGMV